MEGNNSVNNGLDVNIEDVIDVEAEDLVQRKKRKLEEVQKRPVPNFGTLRSKVYTQYTWSPEERQWKCNMCVKQYNHSTKGGSASLLNHLESAHKSLPKEEYLTDEQLASKKTINHYYQVLPQTPKMTYERLTEDGFKKKLIDLIVSTDQPFSFVEAPAFIAYTKFCTLNSDKAKLPCQTTIRTWIMDAYTEEKFTLKQKLLNNAGRISFILDCWTSSNQRPFQGVIACWIDDNWKLCHTPIDLTVLSGEHTGENLAHAFAVVMTEFELWDRLHSITTDNAANMNTMFKRLDEESRERMLDFSSKDYRVRCLAHIINLSCKEVITSVVGRKQPARARELNSDHSDESDSESHSAEDSFLVKLRKAVSTIRSSPQRREIFERFCEKSNIVHKNLLLDVETRWNSTIAMLRRLIEYKEPFLATVDHLKLNRLNLHEDEDLWNKVGMMIKLLEPFLQATKMLSQGHSPTLSDTATVYLYLFRELEKFVDGTEKKILSTRSKTVLQHDIPTWLKNAAAAGWEKLKKYYVYNDNLVYVVSTVLDPRYKMNWFKVSWNKEYVDAARKKVTAVWNTKYKKSSLEDHTVSTTSALNTSPEDGNNKISDFLSEQMHDFHKQDDELKRYLAESSTNPKNISTGIVGALDWWKSREIDYPQLSKMAKDFLAVSATGVPVERLFSCGPDLLTSRRQSLKPETIQQCLCLKQWIKAKDDCYKLEDFRDALIEKLGGSSGSDK